MKNEHTHSPLSQELYERVLVRDGFRCRICNGRGKLRCYSRTREYSHEHDVTVLCSECHILAETRKQFEQEKSALSRILINAAILLAMTLVYQAIGTLPLFTLFILTLVCIALSSAIEALSRVFKA
jgi:hypothetical protein